MRGELGRVNFHKDLWDCYQGQGKQIGQKLTSASPVTIPQTITLQDTFGLQFSFLY